MHRLIVLATGSAAALAFGGAALFASCSGEPPAVQPPITAGDGPDESPTPRDGGPSPTTVPLPEASPSPTPTPPSAEAEQQREPSPTPTPRPATATPTARPSPTPTQAPPTATPTTPPTPTPPPPTATPTQPPPPPPPTPTPTEPAQDCDPSYPTVCIPPWPPDLDCPEIRYRRFAVRPPDPHGFDGDRDGIGCESG